MYDAKNKRGREKCSALDSSEFAGTSSCWTRFRAINQQRVYAEKLRKGPSVFSFSLLEKISAFDCKFLQLYVDEPGVRDFASPSLPQN